MDAATWDVDNWAERKAGGFGVTLGHHVVEQPGTLDMQRAVLAMQDRRMGAPCSASSPHRSSPPTWPLT